MSASASIPHAAVIGKVRRGNSGTPYGQQERERAELRGSFQGKGENDVAASLVVEFYFSPMECLCALVSLIQTGSVHFFYSCKTRRMVDH